jgi:hypothetical protein
MPPRFSFLWHPLRGGVEASRRLVYPPSRGIEDEAVWNPHATSFTLFPGASKTRWRGAHTPPHFPSSLQYPSIRIPMQVDQLGDTMDGWDLGDGG